MRADAFPEQRFRALVLSIAPLVDAQRGSVEVKFSVEQPPSVLREDMSLSVEVETARRKSALVVPLSALRGSPAGGDDGDGGPGSAAAQATLWLEKSGRVEAKAVRLGLRTLESAEVMQGLAAGDVVLLGPSPSPGRRVKAATAAASQAPGKAKSDDAGSALSNAMGR